MAAKRSREQLDEMASFVQALYAHSGAASWSDFAERAGVHPVNLSTWQRGQSMPDGWNLYKLMRAAGGAEIAASMARKEQEQIAQALAQLADGMASLGDAVAVLHKRLPPSEQ